MKNNEDGGTASYISHIGNFELTRLPQSETGDHGAASDRPFIALAVELL